MIRRRASPEIIKGWADGAPGIIARQYYCPIINMRLNNDTNYMIRSRAESLKAYLIGAVAFFNQESGLGNL